MNHNYLNQKLERTEIETEIKHILSDFEENQYNPNSHIVKNIKTKLNLKCIMCIIHLQEI